MRLNFEMSYFYHYMMCILNDKFLLRKWLILMLFTSNIAVNVGYYWVTNFNVFFYLKVDLPSASQIKYLCKAWDGILFSGSQIIYFVAVFQLKNRNIASFCPVCKFDNNQAYSRPRDLRLSASWRPAWGSSWRCGIEGF